MKKLLVVVVLFFGFTGGFAQNEQSPLVEKDIAYKNWVYKSVESNAETSLRDQFKGKKLVMVAYFAPWCPNWKHDVAFVQDLFQRYQDKGFGVIGVGEYDPVASMKTHIGQYKLTFPVVYESDARSAKQQTQHFEYRKQTGDTRNWGSPWYIFLEPGKIEKNGEILTRKAFVVNGELIRAEVEEFIRGRLGLAADENKLRSARNDEICEPDKKAVELLRP